MKKLLLLVVVCFLCLIVGSCDAPTRSFTEYGDEVVAMVSEMANNDEYIRAMIGNISGYDEEFSKVKTIDFSNPSAKYELEIDLDELMKKLSNGKYDFEKLSEPLQDKISAGLGNSLASAVTSKSGSDKLVVASILSAGKCFVDESIKESKYLLYVFEPGCSMLISFVPGEGGAVSASGVLILNDNFKTDSEEQIELSFKELGCGEISASQIK